MLDLTKFKTARLESRGPLVKACLDCSDGEFDFGGRDAQRWHEDESIEDVAGEEAVMAGGEGGLRSQSGTELDSGDQAALAGFNNMSGAGF